MPNICQLLNCNPLNTLAESDFAMSHPCSPICSRILVQWVNKTTNYTSLMVLRIWNKITVRDAYWHDMCFLHFCACKFYIECRKDLDNLIMSLIITSNWCKKPWAKHPILHRFICFQPFACIVNANLRHFNKLLIRFLIGERSLAWQIRLMRILHSKKKKWTQLPVNRHTEMYAIYEWQTASHS